MFVVCRGEGENGGWRGDQAKNVIRCSSWSIFKSSKSLKIFVKEKPLKHFKQGNMKYGQIFFVFVKLSFDKAMIFKKYCILCDRINSKWNATARKNKKSVLEII